MSLLVLAITHPVPKIAPTEGGVKNMGGFSSRDGNARRVNKVM